MYTFDTALVLSATTYAAYVGLLTCALFVELKTRVPQKRVRESFSSGQDPDSTSLDFVSELRGHIQQREEIVWY
jgi:hypothetical protein